MLKELQDSVKARLYDFQSTPFLASVIISWILINHKYLLIYFSNDSLKDKITMLNDYDFSFWICSCAYNVFFPILFGLFYVFVYPKINKYFYDFTLQKRKELKKIKQKIEDETPLSQKEANELMQTNFTLQDEKDELYRKYNALKQEYEVKLKEDKKGLQNKLDARTILYERLENDNNNLIQKIEEQSEKNSAFLNTNQKLGIELGNLKENINKLSKENEKLKNENKLAKNIKPSKNSVSNKYNLSDLEIKILKLLYDANYTGLAKSALEKEIANVFEINIIKSQNIIFDLINNNIFFISASGYVKFTDNGKKILLELFDKQ